MNLGFIDLSMLATQPAVTPAAPAKPKDGSTFSNFATGISNIFQSAAPIVQAVVKPNTPGAPAYNPSLPQSAAFNTQSSQPPAAAAKSNTLKYVAIAAAAAGGIFLVYKIATKKKKALSGVGDPSDSFALSGSKKKKSRKRKK